VNRPLRSLAIGDCDHYFSPYLLGIAMAAGRLNIWHTQISIRSPIELLIQRVRDVRPDILWTHMLLWAPVGAPKREQLLELCRAARKACAHVLVHDGDVKVPCRYPHNLSDAVDLALCNHRHDRSVWGIPTLRWPYAAFPQDDLAAQVQEWACDLAFAGQLTKDGTYSARTALIEALHKRKAVRVFDGREGNTLLRTPELAASATCVLGFGRPDQPGWIDTRVYQYPGAGAILVHDDAADVLEPWVHFAPYVTGDADSIVEAVERVKALTELERRNLRESALHFVQEHHSYTARVQQVLGALGLEA